MDQIRKGDRGAAAAFVMRHEQKIRRRYRRQLGPNMRRLFDSQELLSTVLRRLDRYVVNETIRAPSDGAIWHLVFKIADAALVDRIRVLNRLKQVRDEHQEIARQMLKRLEPTSNNEDFAEQLDGLLRSLPCPTDREIVSLWLGGASLNQISEILQITPAATRKRWERIRVGFREQLLSSEGVVCDK